MYDVKNGMDPQRMQVSTSWAYEHTLKAKMPIKADMNSRLGHIVGSLVDPDQKFI